MAVPAVVLRTPIARDAALALGEKLTTEAGNLPDPSTKPDIVVAQSLGDVDRAAQQMNQFRGKS